MTTLPGACHVALVLLNEPPPTSRKAWGVAGTQPSQSFVQQRPRDSVVVGAVTESMRVIQGDGAPGTAGARVAGSHLEGHLALSIRCLARVYAFYQAVSLVRFECFLFFGFF